MQQAAKGAADVARRTDLRTQRGDAEAPPSNDGDARRCIGPPRPPALTPRPSAPSVPAVVHQ